MNRYLKNKRFKYNDNKCDKSFFTLTEMKEHMISIHKKEKQFNCNYNSCDFKTSYESSLNQHIKSVHKNIRSFYVFGLIVIKVLREIVF